MQMELDDWIKSIVVHPITKQKIDISLFKNANGVYDLRVFLKNTYGYQDWKGGQEEYEKWYASGDGYSNDVKKYLAEIEYDRPIYSNFKLQGLILDVGGGIGTTREFIDDSSKYISCDPFLDVHKSITQPMHEAYKCLKNRLNFIGAVFYHSMNRLLIGFT